MEPIKNESENTCSTLSEKALSGQDSDPTDTQNDYLNRIQLVCVMVALSLVVFLMFLDMTIVATAIPAITADFQGLDYIGWYSVSFIMTLGAFQSTWGKVYKYFSIKWSFLTSILIFELGSLVSGVAPTAAVLILGRAVAGVGSAGMGSGCYTIIAVSASPRKRPALTGLLGSVFGIASASGPVLGGILTDRISWRWCFYINLPIGAVSILVILFALQEPVGTVTASAQRTLKEKVAQLDLLNVGIIIGAIISYVFALQDGGVRYKWGSPLIVCLLALSVILLSIFAFTQWRQGERAMIPSRLLSRKDDVVLCVFIAFFAGAFNGALYYVPVYFQSVKGMSPIQGGIHSLPTILSVAVGTTVSGISISINGRFQYFLIGGAILASTGCGLMYTWNAHEDSLAKWIGFQVVAGIGWGCAFQVPMIACQGLAAPSDIPLVTGIVLFFQCLGTTIIVSATQAAFVNRMATYALNHAPRLDKDLLLSLGASQIRTSVALEYVPIVIDAFMAGIKLVFAICLGASLVSVVVSCGIGWSRAIKNPGRPLRNSYS